MSRRSFFVSRAVPIAAVFALQGCALLLSLDEFEESDEGTNEPAPLVFNIILRQTVMDCVGCGIWFDWQGSQDNKPKLVVEFEHAGAKQANTYQHGPDGMDNAHGFYLSADGDWAKHAILVKLGPQRTGLFRADISDIPRAATISKATLYLHINTNEGFADGDNTSVLAVHECNRAWDWDHATWTHYDDGALWDQPGGDFGPFVRQIRAKEDLRDRGFSRSNPNADFDFTSYVVQLQTAR